MQWTKFVRVSTVDDGMLKAAGGNAVYLNNVYQVLERDLPNGLTMLSIKRRDRAVIHDWRDLQRIKNAIAGPEREAVELYPAESRKTDTANQYFLFVFPPGVRAQFGFTERLVASKEVNDSKQRPFDPELDPLDYADAIERNKTIEAEVQAYLQEFLKRERP